MSSPLLSNYYGLKSIFSDLKYSDKFIANYNDDILKKKEKEIIRKYGENAKKNSRNLL